MTLDEYQAAARRTINPALNDPDRLLDAAAGLAEEAGEVLALIRKARFRNAPLDRERVGEELGDAFWCLTAVASSLELSLGEVAQRNLRKLEGRYPLLGQRPGARG